MLTPKRSFFYFIFTNFFLKKYEDFWFTLSNEHEELSQRDVFIGKLGTEKYIASKNNTEKTFQAKWQVYIYNRSKVYT